MGISKNGSIFVIGSPIVDIFAKVSEEQVLSEGLQKGLLCLLEPTKVQDIVSRVKITKHLIGGSAANTAVGVGFLGGDSIFAGSCGPDKVGQFFQQTLHEKGITSACTEVENKGGTTCVYVLVTEDGERTMLPIYGASRHFSLTSTNREMIKQAKLVFTDAYQFDAPATEKAVLEAFALVKANGGLSSLTLSDPNCVTHYKNKLLSAAKLVDILIGNEDEVKLLFGIEDSSELTQALRQKCLAGEFKLIITTLNKKGSVLYTKEGEVIFNPPVEVDTVVDQTGAGDFFAAGFLHAYLQNYSIETCGKVGSLVASHVVQQVGASITAETKKEVAKLLLNA